MKGDGTSTGREFFDKGISHFRPLVLQDVATIVGVHEATVARVTSNKYVQTPRGVFSLKFFYVFFIGQLDWADSDTEFFIIDVKITSD